MLSNTDKARASLTQRMGDQHISVLLVASVVVVIDKGANDVTRVADPITSRGYTAMHLQAPKHATG